MALFRVFLYILSFEPHDNPEKQRYKPSGLSLSHTGSHPGRPLLTPLGDLAGPGLGTGSPFLLLWPNTRPRTKDRRTQNRLLPRPLSRAGTPAPSWLPLAGFTPYSALFPGPAFPSGPGGSAPPQRGAGGREGGAWNRGCVGGGCASRGAWAGGGRRHVETRGQRLAAQAPK